MSELSYVCLYGSYESAFSAYSERQIGLLVRGMLHYLNTGETPAFTGTERYIWPMLQSQIDRDREKYRKRCETNRKNGAAGGKSKSKRSQATAPKEKENENKKENEKENKKENKKENEKDKEKESERIGPPGRDTPAMDRPTAKQVQLYCLQMGYDLDPNLFVNYYEARGWKLGNQPMRDWKAAVRCWMDRLGEDE